MLIRLPDSLDRDDTGLYFQAADLAEALTLPGYNVERLAIPYIPQVTGKHVLFCTVLKYTVHSGIIAPVLNLHMRFWTFLKLQSVTFASVGISV